MGAVFKKETLKDILDKVNIILFLAALLCVAYLISLIIKSQRAVSVRAEDFKERAIESVSSRKEEDAVAKLDFSVIQSRNVFGEPAQNTSSQEEAYPVVDLKLLGVVSVGERHSAMIRDMGDNKEYYCTGGEKIGPYTVKEIARGRVVLLGEDGSLLELTP